MLEIGDKVRIVKCKPRQLKYLIGVESEIKEIIFDERNKPYGVWVEFGGRMSNIFFEERELKKIE